MAHCSMPFPRLVFCSHIQCVQCRNYVSEDGFPIGDNDVIFPSDNLESLSDVRNEFCQMYKLLKLLGELSKV